MIISASRRTDICAFFSEWMMNRLKAGFCLVPNPYNNKQISYVSLSPVNITAIVFWTRNPAPMMKYLSKLDELKLKYYFQITLNGYPKNFEKYNPSKSLAISNFIAISSRIGAGRVIWRYDPIIISNTLSLDYHKKNFYDICLALAGHTKRVVVSIVDDYSKTKSRIKSLNEGYKENQESLQQITILLKYISEIASQNGMEVQSCAETGDYSSLGIEHGKCIDDALLKDQFGIDIEYKKDKTQRQACGCIESKDIGINNTCVMGCEYCYATTSHSTAVDNYKKHDPLFPMIYKRKFSLDEEEMIRTLIKNKLLDESSQMDLF
jgi:hypothetical protein